MKTSSSATNFPTNSIRDLKKTTFTRKIPNTTDSNNYQIQQHHSTPPNNLISANLTPISNNAIANLPTLVSPLPHLQLPNNNINNQPPPQIHIQSIQPKNNNNNNSNNLPAILSADHQNYVQSQSTTNHNQGLLQTNNFSTLQPRNNNLIANNFSTHNQNLIQVRELLEKFRSKPVNIQTTAQFVCVYC